MKKVLIITYYWIPSGGSGVQRWVKFTKYLRDFGWEPVIYTPENPEFPAIDHSFEKDIPSDIEVLKTPIWEPYNVYRSLTGKKNQAINAGFISEKKKKDWKESLSMWIRGNFLIPDPRRFWVKPSVKFLTHYIENNKIDAVVTTGPPHSLHFIGLRLKKKFKNIPWIADFRDPWTTIYFFDELNLTRLAYSIHRRLERKIINAADSITVVSNRMKSEFENLNSKSIHVITNGYDEEDTKGIDCELDKKFTISHIGLFIPSQNPVKFWKVIAELCSENPQFAADLNIQLVGKIDFSIIDYIEQKGLASYTTILPYMAHDEVIRMQKASQLLLLLLVNKPGTECILPGKLFEYLNARRPILAIGHTNGDAAEVIRNSGVGSIVDFEEEKRLKEIIQDNYKLYKSNNLQIKSNAIERFSRRKLTEQLVGILNQLSK
jgi:glycosyltransferase involved in cell wall biosynthesis